MGVFYKALFNNGYAFALSLWWLVFLLVPETVIGVGVSLLDRIFASSWGRSVSVGRLSHAKPQLLALKVDLCRSDVTET